MGIPYYFYLITKTHHGILSQVPPVAPSAVFLDFNGAIYQAVRKLTDMGSSITDDTLAKETISYLDWLIDVVGSPKEVGVCLDGVAPRAKMMQQRKRRFMGMFRNILEKDAGIANPNAASWDTCAISPGTSFMDGTMARHLREYAASNVAKNVWVSPADEPGEGEHKIFAHMRGKGTTGNVFIYGLDADLIMLSLVSHRPGIFLMREPTQAGIPNLASESSSTSPFIYVNIDALRSGILNMVKQHYKWPVSDAALDNPYEDEARKWIETYIVLCFLLGNDFLPQLPALSLKNDGLETLLVAYGRILAAFPGSYLVENSVISWEMLAALLDDLAKEEDSRVHDACVSNIERRCHAREPVDLIEFYPSLPQNKDEVARVIALGTTNNWRLTYYMGLFDIRRANVPHTMRESTLSYLIGMSWVINYYTARPKDATWFYPFGYAPTVRDLANTLHGEMDVVKRITTVTEYSQSQAAEFVPAVVQLLSILPPTSVDLLPPAARPLMTTESGGCLHFYPKRFAVHTFLKNRLWECHPKLPVLDVDWIHSCYRKQLQR